MGISLKATLSVDLPFSLAVSGKESAREGVEGEERRRKIWWARLGRVSRVVVRRSLSEEEGVRVRCLGRGAVGLKLWIQCQQCLVTQVGSKRVQSLQ